MSFLPVARMSGRVSNPTGASGALGGAGGATAAQTARGTHGDGGRGFFATCGARCPRAPTYISFETAPGAACTAGPSRSRPRHCGARLRLPTLPTLARHSPEVCVFATVGPYRAMHAALHRARGRRRPLAAHWGR